MKKVAMNDFVPKYFCDECCYYTAKTSSWKKHLATKKHIKNTNPTRVCNGCNKLFNSKTSCWRHKKICQFIIKNQQSEIVYLEFLEWKQKNKVEKKENSKVKKNGKNRVLTPKNKDKMTLENLVVENNEDDNNVSDNINNFAKILEKILKSNKNLQEKFEEFSETPNTVNNVYNNNIMINMILNDNCKDAMNLKDFINNMNISLEDLLYTKNMGFVDGISKIFLKQLKDLKPTERPIHCSNTNKLHFYVKEENKWEKDNENIKMDESIKLITKKQIKKIKEWEKNNPNYTENETLYQEWNKMIFNVMGGRNEKEIKIKKEQIKQQISDYVPLDDVANNK
jgi:hypothetical protein